MNTLAKIVDKTGFGPADGKSTCAAYIMNLDGTVVFSNRASDVDPDQAWAKCFEKLTEKYPDVAVLGEETFENLANGGCFE